MSTNLTNIDFEFEKFQKSELIKILILWKNFTIL